MFKKIVSFLAVPALMAVSGATFAAEGAASSGVDLSPLTNSIDFSTVLVILHVCLIPETVNPFTLLQTPLFS